MIILITGASHTGKTALAQKLLEKYQYPYFSVDHLKMGLIRSKNTQLTPEDDDQLQDYLWPIIREMIKTAIENQQNLIIEGCYIPFTWKKDFSSKYLPFIRFYPLVMTENYINSHFDDIQKYANVIENRLEDSSFTKEIAAAQNSRVLTQCQRYGYKPILIDSQYQVDIDLQIVTESERLLFKQMTHQDFPELCKMLQDAEVMYAWEHAFSDEEVYAWLEKRETLYRLKGYDYFLAVDKQTGEVVGQIGLLDEPVEGRHYAGIGYILKKEYWHKGYATEGAKAMLDYAFHRLGEKEVITTIRPENTASRKVAERIGMTIIDSFVKRYNGKDMPHLVYCKKAQNQ